MLHTMTMEYGTITGRLVAAVADTPDDPDVNPDIIPITGTVTFTPSVKAILVASESVTVVPAPIVAVLDANGYVSLNGVQSVTVLATTSQYYNPNGWTYRVSFDNLAANGRRVTFDSYNIEVPVGATVDLSSVTPISSSTGTPIVRGPKGDKGDTGPQGVPGVANDSTVAVLFTSPSQTRTATDSRYVQPSNADARYQQQSLLDSANASLVSTPSSTTRGALDSKYLSISPALEGWLSALANRANTPARILAIGDSITEGSNATLNTRRWVQRLLSGLRSRFTQTPVGGFGHLPPYYIGATMGQPFTSVSSPVPGQDTTFGLGRRCAVMSGANSYTYTITGTSFWLWYTQGPSTGSISVSIDGGAATSVPTSGSPLTDGKTWVSPALTAGTHTVQVSVASGTVYFTGLTVFNGDENSGVQMFEAGHWGWKTTDWANNGTYWPAVVGTIQPQLVTIALMTNDYQGGVDPATCKANLLAMIAAVRAQCTVPPSVVLITYPARGDVSAPAYSWSQYVAAAASIAALDSGVAHLDLSSRYSSPATTNVLNNWASDKVHPTDKGHGLLAETVLSFISPR